MGSYFLLHFVFSRSHEFFKLCAKSNGSPRGDSKRTEQADTEQPSNEQDRALPGTVHEAGKSRDAGKVGGGERALGPSAHRGSRWERRRLGETGLKPSDPGRAVRRSSCRDNAVRRAAGALFKGGGFRVPAPAALPPNSGGGPATPWRSWKIHSGA